MNILTWSFTFCSRCHHSARKGPYTLCLFSKQSPQSCPQNSANSGVIEYRSFLTWEGGMLAASILLSFSLQAISAVMLWPVHVQKILQASEHLCPSNSSPDMLSSHSFPLTPACPWQRSTEVFAVEDCAWLCASRGSPFQAPPFAAGSCENDGMCNLCVTFGG